VLERQFNQARTQRCILRPCWIIAKSGATNVQQLADSPFTKLMGTIIELTIYLRTAGFTTFLKSRPSFLRLKEVYRLEAFFSLFFHVSSSRKCLRFADFQKAKHASSVLESAACDTKTAIDIWHFSTCLVHFDGFRNLLIFVSLFHFEIPIALG
jgi:hypothetical protein